MTINYAPFNEDFFSSIISPGLLKWYNRKGVMEINKETNATIELVTNGVAETYKGYLVSIINKKNGMIDQLNFDFNAFMDTNDRSDTRYGYKEGYKIIEHTANPQKNDYWYIAIPTGKQIGLMREAIIDYINKWQSDNYKRRDTR